MQRDTDSPGAAQWNGDGDRREHTGYQTCHPRESDWIDRFLMRCCEGLLELLFHLLGPETK